MRPPPELLRELEWALADAAAGEPLGPLLLSRLRMVAGTVLRRHGWGAARVEVVQRGRGVELRVEPPPGVPRVQSFQLRLGPG